MVYFLNMCGIFGHVGKSSSIEKCIQGLKNLEYRGYDSSGIAGIDNGILFCYKEEGKISQLEKRLEKKLQTFQSSIAHTRWATHGKPTKLNAHPHLDQNQEIAVVHNGIIENYRHLRKILEEKGMRFVTDTDTEVIAQLISYFYEGDLVKAVHQALSQMKGFWGLAILHKNHPDKIVTTCCENSIIVGISKREKEAFISSDLQAFTNKDLELFYLKNREIALIEKDKMTLFDPDLNPIVPKAEAFAYSQSIIEKGTFEHFMLKEIFEQPEAIHHTLHERMNMEQGNSQFEQFSLTAEEFQKIDQIVFLGCGTSWHAGYIGALQIEDFVKLPASAQISSEYCYKNAPVHPNTLFIALSQSGETFETIAAARKVKKNGAKVLAISNVPNSTLVREADYQILLDAGPEVSVCSTKTFSCQLSIITLLTLYFARFNELSLEEGKTLLNWVSSLPEMVETILNQHDKISYLAKKYASKSTFIFIGRQYMFPTSLEGALKLKEISYINASAYPSGELKHGPIALVDQNCLVVGLCGHQPTYEKVLSNLAEIKAREGSVLALAPYGASEIDEIADEVLWLPNLPDLIAPILYSIPNQLLAYYVAKELEMPIDQPRNLAKSVTVE